MSFDENKINRQSAGTSTGGQFANKDHPANDEVGLGPAPCSAESLSQSRDALYEITGSLNRSAATLMKQEVALLVKDRFPQAQRAYLGIARDEGDGTYIQSVLIEGPDGQFYGSNGDTEVADTLDGLYDRVAETVDRGDVWYVAGGTDDELVLDIEDNLPPADQPQSDPMQDLARALPPQERAELLRILQGETLTEG